MQLNFQHNTCPSATNFLLQQYRQKHYVHTDINKRMSAANKRW